MYKIVINLKVSELKVFLTRFWEEVVCTSHHLHVGNYYTVQDDSPLFEPHNGTVVSKNVVHYPTYLAWINDIENAFFPINQSIFHRDSVTLKSTVSLIESDSHALFLNARIDCKVVAQDNAGRIEFRKL